MNEIVERLRLFMENEARSCSMDFGCVTPLYVYRMWGGAVEFKDIEQGLGQIKKSLLRDSFVENKGIEPLSSYINASALANLS